jgi:hypothetical protein
MKASASQESSAIVTRGGGPVSIVLTRVEHFARIHPETLGDGSTFGAHD